MNMMHTPLVIPPPKDRVAELQRENESLRDQIRELKIKLVRMEEQTSGVEEGVSRIKSALSPLYTGLQQIFGDIEAMAIQEQPSSPESPAPRNKAVWDSWKHKLGGKTGDAIDILHLHGAMNAVQLRMHLKCGKDYVYQVVHQLNKAGLINKNGGKISLKEL